MSINKLKIARQSPVDILVSQAPNFHQVPLISRNQRQRHRLSMTRKWLSVVRTTRNGAHPFPLFLERRISDDHVSLLQVSGMLYNTGQTLVFRMDKDTKQHVNISGGPLAYRYQFDEIYIHYGTENHLGSEHHIHGYSFPAEVSQVLLPNGHESLWLIWYNMICFDMKWYMIYLLIATV